MDYSIIIYIGVIGGKKMFSLPGYIIHNKIFDNDMIEVYKGTTVGSKISVLIKRLKEEASNPANIQKIVHEWEITRNIEIEGILKPIKLEKYMDSYVVIMKDIGGVFLSYYIKDNVIDIKSFLDIAIQLSETLSRLHDKCIMHRDINAENILIQPDTNKVHITNFYRATLFSARNKNQKVMLEGQEYYKNDYYSLGITFFEILRKFYGSDLYDSEIPGVLWDIIKKMISDNPDERYQSSYGLIYDLKKCSYHLNCTGEIKPFQLGQADTFHNFQLPRELYGREKERVMIMDAFERACKGEGELLLVSGYPGVGKTMLINNVLKPIAIQKGYFAYGKFDQVQKNIPYAPFVNAMGNILRMIMTESKEELILWRKKMLKALGKNAAIITEMIPEAELLIGPQPPIEELNPNEAQNRFLMAFSNFIKIFAEKGHPLVLFLDDLQWADLSSLKLINHLCCDTKLNYVLLVGAYRNTEVNEEHPLSATIKEIANEGVRIENFLLSSFNKKETAEFIKGALCCSEENADMISDKLYRESCGIPLFLGQLLISLYENNILIFNREYSSWELKEEYMQEIQIPDGIAELVIEKMKNLSEKTRDILKSASCIGNNFDLNSISAICEKTPIETASLLLPAIMEGLVFQPTSNGNSETEQYEFFHDIVRQAAYFLLSPEEKKRIHVKVGRFILKNTRQEEIENKLLPILEHINRGLGLIEDPEERLQLAEYNLISGRKAKATAAYDSAKNCFKSGIELLPNNSWISHYALSYNLYLELAQCEYLIGDVLIAEELFEIIVKNTKTEIERADVHALKMLLYAGSGKFDEAVEIGISALRKFGISFAKNPGLCNNAKELLLYKWYMRNKNIKDLINLPEMKDTAQKKVAKLYISLILSTCTSHPDLYSYCIIKLGNHGLKYGNTEMTSIGFIGYAITEGSVLGNYSTGYELGKIAIEHAERYGKDYVKCIVYFTVGGLIHHWMRHGKESIQYLDHAVKYALEAGNVLIAGFSYCVILESKFIIGTILDELKKEAQQYRSFARRTKHENLAANTFIYERHIKSLANSELDITSVGINDTEEQRIIKLAEGDKAALAVYYYTKMQICYLMGKYDDALLYAKKEKICENSIMGFMISVEICFYESLTITALYDKLDKNDKKELLIILKKNRKRMKAWAEHCPENYLHKYLLIEAEISRILGNKQKAMDLYDKAIQSAYENSYIQNEAIACELAAGFYMNIGRNRIALTYMSDALRLFKQWGAYAKVEHLKKCYPDLLTKIDNSKEIGKDILSDKIADNIILPNTMEEMPEDNEIYNILNEIECITEYSVPDEIFQNLLEALVKITDSHRGFLILEKDDKLYIEAVVEVEGNTFDFKKPLALEKCNTLSRKIVRYVARTLESVIINNDSQYGIFAKDTYIEKSKAKSIACVPLKHRGISVGVLYLENNLMEEVFVGRRLEHLKFFAGQMTYIKALETLLINEDMDKNGQLNIDVLDNLTEREIEVLRLISSGLSNKEIGERLNMTVNTVKTHIKNIYGKLQVNRRVQAVEKAKKLNIV